jgi:hypothetical protein
VNPPKKIQDRLILPPVQGRGPLRIALNLDVDASRYVTAYKYHVSFEMKMRSGHVKPGLPGFVAEWTQ